MARSTRYVPLTIRPDDTCAIPRIRPHKIPRIYPLVASPIPAKDYCHKAPDYEASTVETSPPNEWTIGSRRWQVIRVSRSERLIADANAASHLSEKRLRDESIRRFADEDAKSMRLLVTGPGQKKQPEVRLFAFGTRRDTGRRLKRK
ncbi:hypothetical protein OSTOST_01892 [Ostertagia ostertagi]